MCRCSYCGLSPARTAEVRCSGCGAPLPESDWIRDVPAFPHLSNDPFSIIRYSGTEPPRLICQHPHAMVVLRSW